MPQCRREPGPSVGGPHLAWQLWTLPELVPQTSGGIWGELQLFVNVLCPPCSHFPIWQSRGLVCVQVSRGHVEGRAWLFIGQCWLAAHKGDGQVERMLRVCTQGLGFAKVELSHTHLETLSYKANASFDLFSHVTLGLNLCACRCCVSSYATTWPTTTSGYRCTAAPALTPSHTPKDLAWACCCCWGTLVSTQPSYHKWMIR